jgi:chromate reductase
VLKNAIDWASRPPEQPFAGKPIAIMGVSNGALGAAFANHHLRQIFVYMDARMVNGPEVMIGDAKNKFDASLNLVHEPTRQFVADHLRRLSALHAGCL